ncbi:MAG: hypothetical protein AAGA92_06835 [Planctomycetota bacterium]
MVRLIAATSVLLASLCGPALCTAGSPAEGGSSDPDARLFRELDIFQELDKDGDGLLRGEEASTADGGSLEQTLLERLLRTGDADGDGALTPQEFEAALGPKRTVRPLTEKRGGRLSGADALALMVIRMDANGDGEIEEPEVPSTYRRPFLRMLEAADLDRNGVLSQQERTRRAPAMARLAERVSFFLGVDVEAELASLSDDERLRFESAQRPPRPGRNLADVEQAREYFERLDANADGVVEADEVPQPLAARFDQILTRADRNGDGKLARGEMLKFAQVVAQIEKARPSDEAIQRALEGLLKRDADGDGRLSPEEMSNLSERRFERADADGDGFLNRAELERVATFVASRLRGVREQMRLGPGPEGAQRKDAEASGR